MSTRTVGAPSSASRRELIRLAVGCGERGGAADGSLPLFMERYFHHVAVDDLREREPVDLAGLAMSHRQLAANRAQGTASVRVYTPTVDEHGWTTGHTVVEIVTDDTPFLVDSVSAELSRQDRAIHIVIHPQMVVRRDVAGNLLEVLDRSANDPDAASWPRDAVVESWIHVEIDRETDQAALDDVAAGLRRVLEDVRVSVEDWPRMRGTATAIADELDAEAPAGLPAEDVAETVRLLRWLADGHFTFLGYREYQLVERDGEDVLVARTGSGLGILRHDQRPTSGSFGRLTTAGARDGPRPHDARDHEGELARHRPPPRLPGLRGRQDVRLQRRGRGRAPLPRAVLLVRLHRAACGGSRWWSARCAPSSSAPGSPATATPARTCVQILETYPRDELFQTSVDELYDIVIAVSQLQERRRTRLFMRARRLRALRVVPGLPAPRAVHDGGAARDGGGAPRHVPRRHRRLHDAGQRVGARAAVLRRPAAAGSGDARRRPRGAGGQARPTPRARGTRTSPTRCAPTWARRRPAGSAGCGVAASPRPTRRTSRPGSRWATCAGWTSSRRRSRRGRRTRRSA